VKRPWCTARIPAPVPPAKEPLRVRFSDTVFAVVKRVPKGRVASYGLVARLAGYPGAARQVGMVLRNGRGLPWWRIVAQDGRVVIGTPEWRLEQIQRLRAEGIDVDDEGRLDYARHAWRPRA
jgi:methylated-DNA-protein-cysteine methyltransferase-like protein